jgi:divalent metal cation (Fe/Co/Zn/Cd) transporter
MGLGVSFFLIAVGAILRYAVTERVSGVSLPTIGLILMIVGIAGLIISVLFLLSARPRGRIVRDRIVERDPEYPE